MTDTNTEIVCQFESPEHAFESETITARSGKNLTIIFIEHGSLAFVWEGSTVYVDPVGLYADYSALPEADAILITHEHGDHLDPRAVEALTKPGTVIGGNSSVAENMPAAAVFAHFDQHPIAPDITAEAVPAYNTSSDRLKFHSRERGYNGYVISFGEGDTGLRVYVAGDTEPIPEMRKLGRIDVAFLPVDLPYTMTPKQAAEAARMVGAPLVFPYHTTDTDTSQIVRELSDTPLIEVRIHRMP